MGARSSQPLALVRGGGELGSAVACALWRAGLRVLVLERAQPWTLRHGVALSRVIQEGCCRVLGIEARHCRKPAAIGQAWREESLPVWTAGHAPLDEAPLVLVEARMRNLEKARVSLDEAPVVIGIGPGLEAGRDVHYVIESERGPGLGSVICQGQAAPHSGIPGVVHGEREKRLLRAPREGVFERGAELGDFVECGEVVGHVDGDPVRARLGGMIRGLKLSGVPVGAGHKVGDVDPRRDRALLTQQTDKSRAIGEGALEALRLAGVTVNGRRFPNRSA